MLVYVLHLAHAFRLPLSLFEFLQEAAYIPHVQSYPTELKSFEIVKEAATGMAKSVKGGAAKAKAKAKVKAKAKASAGSTPPA